MMRETLEMLTRRDLARLGVLVAVLLGIGLWGAWKFLEEATPEVMLISKSK